MADETQQSGTEENSVQVDSSQVAETAATVEQNARKARKAATEDWMSPTTGRPEGIGPAPQGN